MPDGYRAERMGYSGGVPLKCTFSGGYAKNPIQGIDPFTRLFSHKKLKSPYFDSETSVYRIMKSHQLPPEMAATGRTGSHRRLSMLSTVGGFISLRRFIAASLLLPLKAGHREGVNFPPLESLSNNFFLNFGQFHPKILPASVMVI